MNDERSRSLILSDLELCIVTGQSERMERCLIKLCGNEDFFAIYSLENPLNERKSVGISLGDVSRALELRI
jgi:hypothetical protein